MKHKRLLFITNAELGQANVFLAVIQELLSLDPNLDLHLCSFAFLSQSITSLNDACGSQRQVTFHELRGPTWKEALFNRPEHRWLEICGLAPTTWNAREAAPMMPRVASPWKPDELVDLVQQVEKIVLDIGADLVLVDNLFTPAVTVCYDLQVKWFVLSPNTYREFILGHQPRKEWIWKHPPTASLIPHPVPFYQIPFAWYHQRQYMKNPHNDWVVAHAMHIQEKINKQYSDWGRISFDAPKGLKIILPSNSYVDFPFTTIPDHIISCGPIVRPAAPVNKSDPDLATWLQRRPTIYIALGTHVLYDEDTLKQLTGAVKSLLQAAKESGEELQILWKINTRGNEKSDNSGVAKAIGPGWYDHVRIVDWLHTEPISILHSGSVVCSVNHGGANSYFEAVSAGVPQVVLPVWFDTYDFARRVEYFGIGRIGNRRNAPRCSKDELARVLKMVVLGKSARKIRDKAAGIAEACRAYGDGRAIAAKAILDELLEEKERENIKSM